jgi:glycosyltransferase involved in cell wall biosynthesis
MMNRDYSPAPLVSVVIPTRNRPDYLREAIASALEQTYSNVEILVRDNASDDETRHVIESFSDSRIKYHRHSVNIGPTRNVIDACRVAEGKYVANLHDDDIWEPDFLAKLVPPLEEHPDAVISFSDHHIIDSAGRLNCEMTVRNTRQWKRDILQSGFHKPLHRIAVVNKSIPLSMAAVIRKDAIEWEAVPDLPSCYDFWLMYLVSRDGRGGYYVPERLTRYRVHDGSETAVGRMRMDQAYVTCCENILRDPRMQTVWPEMELELAHACTDLGVTLARSGRVEEGRPFLRRGLDLRWTLRGLTLYAMSFSPLMSLKNGDGNAPTNVVPVSNGGATSVRENK